MRMVLALAVGVAAGIAVGAAMTYRLIAPRAAPAVSSVRSAAAAPAPASRAAVPPSRAATPVAPRAGLTAARAELYALAAAADATQLEQLVASTAAAADREPRLTVLLTRYAELDPARAVELARNLGLPASAAAPLYAAWAERDADAALAALSAVAAPGDAGTIAVAVLPALGDPRAFERVVAALGVRPLGRAPFAPDRGADPGTVALERLAEGMARQDLGGAVAQLREIGDLSIRTAFETVVLREWARADPDGALDSVATLDGAERERAIGVTLRDLSRADPRRALDVARRFSGPSREMIERAAVQRLAETDAREALRYVEEISAGPQRRQLLQQIAGPYGRQHPEEALAWLRTGPQDRGLLGAVLGGIAVEDPNRAFALAAGAPAAQRLEALQYLAASAGVTARDQAAMADRILTLGDLDTKQAALTILLSGWGYQAPEDALDWLLRSGQDVPASVYHNIGRQVATRDPATAARYVALVPAAARPGWIAAVAQGMAETDAGRSVAWLDQFRGQPGYAEGVQALVPQLARSDAAAAARLLATMDGAARESPNSVRFVASAWIEQDPAAAAQWVLGLQTQAARAAAIPPFTAQWSAVDLPAAKSWALSLAPGAERDAALGELLFASAAQGSADPAIATAFSSSASLERAAMRSVQRLGGSPQAARIASGYLSTPAQRERAERLIDDMQRAERGEQNVIIGDGDPSVLHVN